VDVGVRAGFEKHWGFYNDQVKLIGFEADAKECEKLNRRLANSRRHFFPVALDEKRGTRTFYVTALPDASGFYEPNMQFWQRFHDEVNAAVDKTIEIETIGFDCFVSENNIDQVDFIKLDTQGSELDILKGAISTLGKSVLGLSIEVEFGQVLKDQPVFSDVDSFLRPLGFHLFDLSIYRHVRKSIHVPSSSPVPGPTEQGQVLWGQVLYLRDGVDEIEHKRMLGDSWDDLKIHKLASLMELFCLPDCAIELIQVAKKAGFLQEIDINHYVDLLVAGTSSSQAVIARTKQLSIRFLPKPLLVTVRSFLVKLRDLINKVINV
jgi:FkbM family methyltransferase